MNIDLTKMMKRLLMITSSCVLLGGTTVVMSEPEPQLQPESQLQPEPEKEAINTANNDYLSKIKFRKKLHHNPFIVPDYVGDVNGNSSSNISESNLEIRAVLLGGKNSLVNVNGTILAVGQDINGYELKSVDENHVVFIKRGNEIVLDVSKNSAANEANVGR